VLPNAKETIMTSYEQNDHLMTKRRVRARKKPSMLTWFYTVNADDL
jgi:hypothetical protein